MTSPEPIRGKIEVATIASRAHSVTFALNRHKRKVSFLSRNVDRPAMPRGSLRELYNIIENPVIALGDV